MASERTVRNRLLNALPPHQLTLVIPHLRFVPMPLHQVLIEANAPVEALIFPETGFISITTGLARAVEVGLIGPEGVAGASCVLLGSDRCPYVHVTQAAGEAAVLDVAALPDIEREIPGFREHLLRYVHTLMVQTAQTAFSNATYNIEPRLARWLLMCQDRLGGSELAVTHELLSIMLGVQRSSVTLAVQALESRGLILARRARIAIRDRERLTDLADDGYGLPEAEYARLFPALD